MTYIGEKPILWATDMMKGKRYTVSRKRSALKAMRRFPPDVRLAVEEAIESLADDPRPQKYEARKIKRTDYWRLIVRRGWRVIYEINDKERTVNVIEISTKEGTDY